MSQMWFVVSLFAMVLGWIVIAYLVALYMERQ